MCADKFFNHSPFLFVQAAVLFRSVFQGIYGPFGNVVPFRLFMCAAITYRFMRRKAYRLSPEVPVPISINIAEGWIGKLVPVVVVEEFHPQRIVVEHFPAVPEDADMVCTYVHGL